MEVYQDRKLLKIAIHRFLIFRKEDGYYLVSQMRKGFDSTRAFNKDLHNQMSHSDNEDANWITLTIPKQISLDKLLQSVDSISIELKDGRFIPRQNFTYSGQELQFSLRRYLMKEGIHLPDVIDISSQS